MGVTVTFCAQAEHERRQNESYDSFFFACENELLPGFFEFRTPPRFQFSDWSFSRGRTRAERYFFLMLRS